MEGSPKLQRTLVVVHYHLRPGGVRSVIGGCLPEIVSRMGFTRVVMVVGETARDGWLERVREVAGVPVEQHVEEAVGYLSEQSATVASMRERIDRTLGAAIPSGECGGTVIWFHNPALARNILLNERLAVLVRRTGIRLVAHHHDFWVENRWDRWPEVRRAGFRTLAGAARAVFMAGAAVSHAAITRRDRSVLGGSLERVDWLPNPLASGKADARDGRRWLSEVLGDDAPVWILPTRLLRRKNVAEAILLARWLRPGGWFVSTGGASSPAERNYVGRIASAAREGRWRVRFDLCSTRRAPGALTLMAGAEAVLLTSIQEGFGMPFLEAGALGRPLIGRRIPGVQPDLDDLGLVFPHLYDEVLIPQSLFDSGNEAVRQARLHREWLRFLPRHLRASAAASRLLEHPGEPVPFSRLTLSAQLEVLRHPPRESLAACLGFNPTLDGLQDLKATRLPATAARFLSASSAAGRFHALVESEAGRTSSQAAVAAQCALIEAWLGGAGFFPVLMDGASPANRVGGSSRKSRALR